jgi:hypothetical protein
MWHWHLGGCDSWPAALALGCSQASERARQIFVVDVCEFIGVILMILCVAIELHGTSSNT